MAPSAMPSPDKRPVVPQRSNTDHYGGRSTPPARHIAQQLIEEPEIGQLFSLGQSAIIVTGAARGLGLTIAAACVESGADVYCCDIMPSPSEPEWRALQDKAIRFQVQLGYRQLDITDGSAVDACFTRFAADSRRPITGVVHSAGVMDEQPAIEYDMKAFSRVMRINVEGTMNVAKAAAHRMRDTCKGGSIVLIASMSGTIANRGITATAYNSSKAACHQLCRSLAVEWGQYGIRANTISPGYIRTAMTNLLLEDKQELLKRWENDNPLSRIGLPSELKGPAVFLLSEASSFVTGADFRIDGGHCAW